jgi:hypothetical protein
VLLRFSLPSAYRVHGAPSTASPNGPARRGRWSRATPGIPGPAGLADALAFLEGFVGTRIGVSADAPYLDSAYKLVAHDSRTNLLDGWRLNAK